MKPLQSLALCCLLTAPLASLDARAFAGPKPVAHVEVSKPATSLPGSRYAWISMPPQISAEFDKRVQDPQLRQRLQAALDKALQAKGYRRVDDVSQADVAVAYRVGVRDSQLDTVNESSLQSANETAIECGAGGCSQIVTQGMDGAPTITIDSVEMIEGGLMVEVLQPGEVRVLWRSLYRGSVRAKDRRSVNLDTIATQTLAQLPKASGAP